MLLVRFLVKSRLLVKFGRVKSCTWIFSCAGIIVPNPLVVPGSIVRLGDDISYAGKQSRLRERERKEIRGCLSRMRMEMRESSVWLSGRRAFQTEDTASA